ncbi:serine hydrolase domain-containing protein [Dyadobacter fermentans]|uniref:Beta-lactamase n=1 Tax=Dyadobacter fermentans (strain ATCC 700827 / DSM 18053 / CIP 107007 / KCTC 52180 / NS114) TaxID=471854 RepID=C6VUP7_DYAFD|nr:serine hydrolase [Dyadobacter fermentans]ACT93034.1 beta-lactamase [Dyadobacter fermentans DSM 18053]
MNTKITSRALFLNAPSFRMLAFIIAILSLNAEVCSAQGVRMRSDSLARVVRDRFNLGSADSIYAMTAQVYRARMSREKFAAGLSKFRAKMGRWVKFDFKEANDRGVDYWAEFEEGRQIFSIQVGENDSLVRINFSEVSRAALEKAGRVPGNNPMQDSLDHLIEQVIRPYIQQQNTCGLAIAVITKGGVRRFSYGSTSMESKLLPDPEMTLFEIGSVTKAFTALLLSMTVVSGKVNIDDPVSQFLPDSIPLLGYEQHPVTLKHLANHTSGLPRLPANIFTGAVDPRDPYRHYRRDSLYQYLMHFKETQAPGKDFSYSNLGAGILGTVLENVWQKTFEELLIEKICRPLKMDHTTITLSKSDQKNFAVGYNENGLPTPLWDLGALKGSGAIRSSLNDMIRFTQAQLSASGSMASAARLMQKTTFESETHQMGLGWRINADKNMAYFHHAGGTGGFRSFVGFDVQRQLGIVILSNAAQEVAPAGETILRKCQRLMAN